MDYMIVAPSHSSDMNVVPTCIYITILYCTDIWNLEFVHRATFEKAANIKTPAALEALILKEVVLNEGDFAFIEWPKLKEEVLITNDRTALISSDTCKSRKILLVHCKLTVDT